MAADGTIKINTELDSSKAQSAMKKFSGSAKSALKGITVAAGTASAAITAMAGYAVKVGADFEAGMSKVSAISGAAGADLDRLTAKAKEMGGKTKFSATEAASAFEYMAMAGWKTEDMLDGIEGVMNLAAASGENLAMTSDIVTDAITAFGLTAKDSGHFVDVLAKASSNSNTNVGMMGETFKYVAPVAGALGFSVDDCAVAIGLMANSGIKASQAGTTLRQIFTNLVKPTDAMQGAMDKLGISLTDSKGKTKSLNPLMGELRSSFSGLTEAEKANYAATLAGQEGMSGFLAIVNASDADFEALKSSIANADGAAESMAETMQDNLKGSLTILGSAMEGFGIKVYDQVKGPLKEAADTGTECVNRLSDAFDSGGLHGVVEEAGEIFGELANRVAESSDEAEKIVTPLRNVAKVGSSLAKTGIKAAAKAFELLATNLDIAVPLLVSGVTAVKGYTAAKTAARVISKLSKAYTASAAALDLFIVANGTSAVATAASTGAITLKQIAVGVFTKQLGLATAAHAAFNAVVGANPVGLAVTAVAALTAGLVAYTIVTKDAKDKTYELSDSEKETLESCNALTDSLNDQRAARGEAVQSINKEYDGYQHLLAELRTITDENGRVKEGYEERAGFIAGELSDALGTEIELTDGVIQNYQETVGALDEVITKKKAASLCASLEEEMAAAYKNSQAALLAYKDATAVMEEKENALAEAQAHLNEVTDMYGNNSSPKAIGAINEAKQAVSEAENAFNEASVAVDEASTSLNALSAEVNNYNALMDAMQDGTVAEIESAMSALLSGYQGYTAEMLATSDTAKASMLEQASEMTGALSVLVKEHGQMYQAFGDEAANSAAKAVSEFQKLPDGIKEAVDSIGTDGAGAMVAALAQADFDGKLSEESKASYEAFMTGIADLPQETQNTLSDAVEGAMEGLEGFDQIKDKAEEESISFLEALREVLQINSPSKKVMEIFEGVWEGASKGLDVGGAELNTKGTEVCNSFLDTLRNSGVGEALKGIGSNLMSLFGIGIASQQGQSMSAGQGNAEAARTGAGSVDPSGVGMRFGGMLGAGVGGTAGTLLQKGKEIADRAKTGAGTVNPTSTGGKFGSQYAAGVGGKSLSARGKGKDLADNAKSGAASVSAQNTGFNFGLGFAGGIRNAIGNAVSAAASLASNALAAIKSKLDIHSPSKKTKKSGKWFSQGFGIGIESEGRAVEESAKSISQTALDALTLDTIDLDGLAEKLKSIDIPETMMRVNMAVESRQETVADKIIRGHVVADRMDSLFQDKQHSFSLSDADAQKIGRIFAERAAPIMVKSLEKSGIRMEMYGEKVGSLVSPSVDSNLAVASIKSRRYMR